MQLAENQLIRALTDRARRLSGILIYGSDASAVAELGRSACAALSRQQPGGATIARIDAGSLKSNPSRLADEYGSMSLLGDRQVIVVSDCDESALPAVAKLLAASVAGDNFVVLMADALSKSSKLRSACEAAAHFGCVPVYEESASDLRQRLSSQFAQQGLQLSKAAADIFFELVGSDRTTAQREAEKLAVYCYGQSEIGEDDVMSVCGQTGSHSVDALCDAVLAGQAAETDRLFSALDGESANPGSVLAQMLYQVQRLQVMCLDMSTGATVETAMQRAKPPVFYKRKSIVGNQLRRFDIDACEQFIRVLSGAVAESRSSTDLANEVVSRALFRLSSMSQAL